MELPNKDSSYGLIYCTTNLVSGRKYIGKLTYIKSKDGVVRDRKTNYIGSSPLLWRAIQKHGKENFVRETLQFCIDREDLKESEIYWIDYFGAQKSNLFYNIHGGGEGGYVGEEAGKKISAANKRRILRGEIVGFQKGIGSKPYAHKISAAKKGKPWSKKMHKANPPRFGAEAHNAKEVVQLEMFTQNIVRKWGCAKQAAQFLQLHTIGTIDSLCRRYKTGVVGKKKCNNKTGFSWMYLKDYEKIYGKI